MHFEFIPDRAINLGPGWSVEIHMPPSGGTSPRGFSLVPHGFAIVIDEKGKEVERIGVTVLVGTKN